MVNKKIKYVIAVSGGPDSMYLLNKYKNKNIVVAHVNYHYRGEDSNNEQKLVEDYCNLYKIKLEILDVNDELINKYEYISNKQARSRKMRYDFFYDVANQNQTNKILIAHNKDDFLETAIMQKKRDVSKLKLFFGIKKKSSIKNNSFIIIRPILNLWKDEIINFNNKNNIPYLNDKSNESITYQRNLIRKIISSYKLEQKEEMYKSFLSINKFNKTKSKANEKTYIEWMKKEYSIKYFNLLSDDVKKYLIFTFVYQNDDFIKLSIGKLENIIKFISNNNYHKEFKVREDIFLSKKDRVLKLTYR